VPYPLALGLWVGLVSQFIPTIGTYLAGALPVLISLYAHRYEVVTGPLTGEQPAAAPTGSR
jgi:predicted PurR-regulated permease PerM